MTSTFASLGDPAPYHLLAYGTLLGSTLFQSFIGGVVAFRVLPRPQFASLQSKIFPVYFTLQTLIPAALYLTQPSSLSNASLSPTSTFNTATNLTIAMAAGGLLNLVLVGPQTTAVMKERKHQETRDGKKSYDAGPHSEEMQALNRKFAILHGVSSATNLVVLGAVVAYAFLVGARL
ncbi:uncharacterized protein J3D65DRAFT_578290 [Phyllosticta citribraziliensis]|uniref:TMEM205-like domain-containing protein n=1 Tax=Phyllosticta citribraziliensis TaxID=989973 RepID=A0ABR1LCT8_9PEZI